MSKGSWRINKRVFSSELVSHETGVLSLFVCVSGLRSQPLTGSGMKVWPESPLSLLSACTAFTLASSDGLTSSKGRLVKAGLEHNSSESLVSEGAEYMLAIWGPGTTVTAGGFSGTGDPGEVKHLMIIIGSATTAAGNIQGSDGVCGVMCRCKSNPLCAMLLPEAPTPTA